jgi:nucleoid DNA-binding protein
LPVNQTKEVMLEINCLLCHKFSGVEISSYITDLLDEQEYVIVPGLGAFISSYRPAKFSDDKNTLLPPSRSLSFNPELKTNDGLLIRYIAQQLKITSQQASRLIEKFSGDVMVQLELGEEVFIGSIGSLALKHGELQFNPGELSKENSESFGLQPLSVSDNAPAADKKEAGSVVEERKKPFSFWIWTGSFLLILLIALSLYFIFYSEHQTIKQSEPAIPKDTSATQKPEPQISPDSTVIKQNETGPASKDSIIQRPGKELYYTIGGSFKSQQNANEYYEKMSLKGFQPIQLGLVGNFYLVALDTFNTAQGAFAAADQYARIYRKTDIWIYHPK